MENKKVKRTRLLDVVLEKLENEQFRNDFNNPEKAHKAVHKVLHEHLEDGHEITISKKDLTALASLDTSKFSKIHKDKEPPIFGVIFFGPVPEDD